MLSRLMVGMVFLALSCVTLVGRAESTAPVVIGLSAEFGLKGSQAAQSIEKGIRLAISEINAAGGVLGGRMLALETRDDRGVPARGIDNFKALSEVSDLVAVFCGRFSPVAIEVAPLANQLGLLLLDPWAAADGITRHAEPNYVFRLSLTDSWAIDAMLDHAAQRKLRKMALFVPNTGWGRSSEAAVADYVREHAGMSSETNWYNWGDTDFSARIADARRRGAQALLMVANEAEGSLIVRQMAQLPPDQRLPIISHWGILGGDFRAATGDAIDQVDLVVVHTFSFSGKATAQSQRVASNAARLLDVDVYRLHGLVGFAHAYDLTHLLAQAIKRAGSTDRNAIRIALGQVEAYDGLVRHYKKPFGPGDQEALDRKQVFLGRYDKQGTLKPLARK